MWDNPWVPKDFLTYFNLQIAKEHGDSNKAKKKNVFISEFLIMKLLIFI